MANERATRRITALAGGLLIAVLIAPTAQSRGSNEPARTCHAPTLPARFPFDSHVLRAEVLEPAIEVTVALPSESALVDRWAVRVQATQPVYLPDGADQIDLLLYSDDCRPLGRQELIDRFLTGDTLEIAALSRPGDGLLEAPADWVRLMDENTSRGIDTPFEYFATLFDLESRENDSERALAMHRIAAYLDREEQFLAVIEAYIDSKRMRKQLRTVYRDLHDGR